MNNIYLEDKLLQEDGATLYYAIGIIILLKHIFNGWIISRNGLHWLPRLSDLTVWYYFLIYLKGQVYKNNLGTKT